MTAIDLADARADLVASPVRWRARFCARFSRVCALLSLAHHSRVPF